MGRLESREYQVAMLYGELIDDLSGLLSTDDDAPLDGLRDRARTAEREISRQMDEFRRLAAEFRG